MLLYAGGCEAGAVQENGDRLGGQASAAGGGQTRQRTIAGALSFAGRGLVDVCWPTGWGKPGSADLEPFCLMRGFAAQEAAAQFEQQLQRQQSRRQQRSRRQQQCRRQQQERQRQKAAVAAIAKVSQAVHFLF